MAGETKTRAVDMLDAEQKCRLEKTYYGDAVDAHFEFLMDGNGRDANPEDVREEAVAITEAEDAWNAALENDLEALLEAHGPERFQTALLKRYPSTFDVSAAEHEAACRVLSR